MNTGKIRAITTFHTLRTSVNPESSQEVPEVSLDALTRDNDMEYVNYIGGVWNRDNVD